MRFDEEVLTFYDPDGLKLELVAGAVGDLIEPWSNSAVPSGHAIRGSHSMTLAVQDTCPIVSMIEAVAGSTVKPSADNTRGAGTHL